MDYEQMVAWALRIKERCCNEGKTEDSICGIYEDVFNDDTLLLIASEYFGIEKTA